MATGPIIGTRPLRYPFDGRRTVLCLPWRDLLLLAWLGKPLE